MLPEMMKSEQPHIGEGEPPMRMRIARSALAAVLIAAVAVGGNGTAASAETSALSANMDMVHCC